MSNRISTVIKAVTDLPARLFGGNAQKVEVSGLDYTLHLDLEKLPPAEAGEAPGKWTVVWDEVTNTYRRVEFTDLPPPAGSYTEAIDDRVAQLLLAGANVAISYNDTAGTVTISAAPSGVIAGSLGNVFDSKAAAEVTSLAPGTKSLLLNGYAEIGDAGQVLACKRVNAQPLLHTGWLRTTDRYTANSVLDAVNGGYWEYTYPAEGIRIEWFGGKADAGTTDNTPAYERCEKFIATNWDGWVPDGTEGNYLGGPKILWGPCYGNVFTDSWYYCATTLRPKRTVAMYGSRTITPSANGAWGTVIRFPPGVTAIELQGFDTSPNAWGAGGSHFEDILFQSTSLVGGVTDKHGFDGRVAFSMRNCSFRGFSGNGCNIAADTGVKPGNNANLWRIERCSFKENAKDGIEVAGGDSNAGFGDMLDTSGNFGFGVNDHSFLANTYVACHAASNRLGAYRGGGGNAPCVFIGCYSEVDQPPSQADQRCTFIGGLHGAGVDTSFGGLHIEGSQFHGALRISPASPPNLSGSWLNMSFADSPGSVFAWSKYIGGTFAGGPYNFRHYSDYGYVMEYGNSIPNWSYIITPPEGATLRAPRIAPNQFMLPYGVYLGGTGAGGVNQTRLVQYDVAKPSGANIQYIKGDIAFDRDATTVGWMCTRTGVNAATWLSGTSYSVGAIRRTPGGRVYLCTAIPYDPDAWSTPASTVRPTHSIAVGLQHYPEPNPHIDPGEAATIPGYTWEAFDAGATVYPDWVSGTVYFAGFGFTDPTTHISYWIQSPPTGNGMPVQPAPIFNTPWSMPASTVEPTHTSGTVHVPEPNPSPSGTEPATIPGYQWEYLSSDPTPEWKAFGPLMGQSSTTVSDPIFNTAQTWNGAGVEFWGHYTNITDTASATASNLEVWSVNGVPKAAIRKDGVFLSNGVPVVMLHELDELRDTIAELRARIEALEAPPP